MTATPIQSLTLEAFLKLPYIEESPAWEYTPAGEHTGQARQKSMPQTQHSRLQFKLCEAINQISEDREIACAFPELRCTFGDRSLVPDISVLRWNRIPMTPEGDLINKFNSFPDWTIEILSPDQSSNRVAANILHGLKHGSELGWLLDPSDRSILVFRPKQEPVIFARSDRLPVLAGIDLEMSPTQIFDWLKMKRIATH
ncbi:Uma2 family endonuclease [Roseofilum capinflatum]|uniref:Uma2 family endonuclease n=1 Tax=Roseofilum capinflatum BLCC-M114 TaxID=3022440 RepID=A0ABT7B9B2_9CYAN|nr:Uma2 family endonuclease [Roseofilum capinflatum]MDJ1175769.1 Uma2 family endonuclease [Roseofilum capinflatum BLCC-M114]